MGRDFATGGGGLPRPVSWALATPVILWTGQKYPLRLVAAGNWLRCSAAYLAIGAGTPVCGGEEK